MKKILFIFLLLVLVPWAFIIGYIYSWTKFLPPHYHANFAMYIENQRKDFSADMYMQDIAGCSITWEKTPQDRVHLHQNNQDTIHIHSDWASWGHFFANNNFYLSENKIISDSGEEFLVTEKNNIHYILNEKEIKNPYNTLISSQDRLLIAYGNYSQKELVLLYESVSKNAWEFNSKYDPGSCGWINENWMSVLFKNLFDFSSHKH
jgi:hypothetical protein